MGSCSAQSTRRSTTGQRGRRPPTAPPNAPVRLRHQRPARHPSPPAGARRAGLRRSRRHPPSPRSLPARLRCRRHALFAGPRMVDAERLAAGEQRGAAVLVDHRDLAILAIAVAAPAPGPALRQGQAPAVEDLRAERRQGDVLRSHRRRCRRAARGQRAPTAMLDELMPVNWPVSAQRPTMEKVMARASSLPVVGITAIRRSPSATAAGRGRDTSPVEIGNTP